MSELGMYYPLKKKRIPTVLGPTKRLVSLVNSEVYFTELFQKIRYQYFECNDSSRKWFFTISLTFMMSEIPGRIEKWPQISNFITSSFNGDTLSSVFFNFQKKWLDYLRGDFF